MYCKEFQRKEHNVGIVSSTSAIIGSAGECIQLTHCLSRLVVKCEVEAGEV